MNKMIRITLLKDLDGEIVKSISFKNGVLVKKAKATVSNGYVEHKEFTQGEFEECLNSLKQDECLILGQPIFGTTGKIVGSKELQDISNGKFARNLDNFKWHDDLQLIYFDYEGAEENNLSPEQFIDIIAEIIPEFANVNKVVKYSSSANIYSNDGKLLSDSNGFHIYFLVNHPEKIEEIFKGNNSWLSKKLWCAGHGWIKNSNPKDRRTTAVRQMPRTIVDHTVFSPERIVFEAAPLLENGLTKKEQGAYLIEGSKDYLDLDQCVPLADDEEQQFLMTVNQKKTENTNTPFVVESKRTFIAHTEKSIDDGSFPIRPEFNALTPREIAEKEHGLSLKSILPLNHRLLLETGEEVTVQNVLDNVTDYNGRCCHDPHEPDYGNSDIAIIYSDQDVPVIFSHAHGGITYRMKPDSLNNLPDFWSEEYWMNNFFIVVYDKKNEVFHINGNIIEKLSVSGFKNKYNGYKLKIKKDSTSFKTVNAATWQINSPFKKCIEDDGFNPGKPIIYKGDRGLVLNQYVPDILRKGLGIPTESEAEQAAEPFLRHIRKLLHRPEDAELVIQFFAYLIQHPSERPMFALLIISKVMGVGKDTITEIFSKMLGDEYCKKPNMSDISREDAWGDPFCRSKLIVVSECGTGPQDRYEVGNSIKNKITAPTMSMNIKHGHVVNEPIYCGMVFYSNHQLPFRFEEGDRRFFVSRCDWSQEEADRLKDDGYFLKLFEFYRKNSNLNGLYYHLLNYNITTNFKGDAPMTPTKKIMMKSEPNEVEDFFRTLEKHPCRYWTTTMIDSLFQGLFGTGSHLGNSQYTLFIRKLLDIGPVKISGQSYRIKTFLMKDADVDNSTIREHVKTHWGKTTLSIAGSTDPTETRHSIADTFKETY